MTDLNKLKKSFNKYISKKKSLYTQESTSFDKHYDSLNNVVNPKSENDILSEIILNLHEHKFKFTQKHFDKIIDQSIFGTLKSYLTNEFNDKETNYRVNKRKKVLTILFKKYCPSPEQLKKMFKCNYNPRTMPRFSQNTNWIDILISSCKLTNEHIQALSSYEPPDDIITKLVNKVDNPLIFLLQTKYASYHGYQTNDFILNYINKNKLKIKTEHLNTLIALAYSNGKDTNLTSAMLVNSNIYMNCYGITFRKLLSCIINKLNKCENIHFTKILYFYICSWGTGTKEYGTILEEIIKKIDNIDGKEFTLMFEQIRRYPHYQNLLLKKSITNDIKNGNNMNVYDLLFKKYIIKNNGYHHLFKILVEKGYMPSIVHLQLACINGNYEAFDAIIAHGIIPGQKCLEYAYYSGTIKIIEILMNYKMLPDENCLIACSMSRLQNFDKIKLISGIFSNGGTLTHEALKIMLRHKINYDYKKMGIPFNDNLYEMLHFYAYIPQCYINDINANKKLVMRRMFLDKTLNEIRKYIDDNNLEPDIYCFENLYLNNNMHCLIDYINNKCKLEPSMLCIYRAKINNELLISMFTECENKIINPLFKDIKLYNQKIKEYTE